MKSENQVSNLYLFMNQIAISENHQMDMILGKTIEGLGHYVREFKTDLIVVHDRVEALQGRCWSFE